MAAACLACVIPLAFACSRPPAPEPVPVLLPPAEIEAVRFIHDLDSFAGQLGDDVLMAASLAWLKDTDSYRKAVDIKAPTLRRVLAMDIAYVSRKGLRYILYPATPAPVPATPAPVPAPASSTRATSRPVPPTPANSAPVPATPAPPRLPQALVVYHMGDVFRLDLAGSYRFIPDAPPDPEPRNHFPSLAESLVGITGEGALTAIFNFGPETTISCRLLPDDAPLTVASFVALARGMRFVRQTERIADTDKVRVDWVKRPWYDGLRGRPAEGRLVLQFTSPDSPGFVVPDEFSLSRRHDAPALLTTVPDSPERWDGDIAITTAPVKSLDDRGTVFGVCDPAAVDRLSRAWSLRKGIFSVPRLQNVRFVRQ